MSSVISQIIKYNKDPITDEHRACIARHVQIRYKERYGGWLSLEGLNAITKRIINKNNVFFVKNQLASSCKGFKECYIVRYGEKDVVVIWDTFYNLIKTVYKIEDIKDKKVLKILKRRRKNEIHM